MAGKSETLFRNAIYEARLHDELLDASRKPYRVFSTPPDTSLYHLGLMVLHTFSFDTSLEFGFYDDLEDKSMSEIFHVTQTFDGENQREALKALPSSQVFPKPSATWLFAFEDEDGEEWQFQVTLKEFRETPDQKPKLLEKSGQIQRDRFFDADEYYDEEAREMD